MTKWLVCLLCKGRSYLHYHTPSEQWRVSCTGCCDFVSSGDMGVATQKASGMVPRDAI